ncbi:DUF177 domain-containing protein [Gymnodinialimonas sp. 2305UL16-5]|uniref:YceD family protein n=1 Tax=Gymnodinialimonas mytili TaxID=3126503 RepID=UPI003097AB95
MTHDQELVMASSVLSLSRLNRAADTPFELVPTPEEMAQIAQDLGATTLRKVRLTGNLRPIGKQDWALNASLGATAVQPCGVTLAPVTTRIDTDVTRHYLAEMPAPSGDEMEMPEDDTTEPLPDKLDLTALLIEALSLALPDFPRAEGVELGEAIYAAPGVTPMRDEDAKPLAGLAALRDKLSSGRSDEPENDD